MLGSDRFTFETPNVIDPGDMPPSQPGRRQPQADATGSNNGNSGNLLLDLESNNGSSPPSSSSLSPVNHEQDGTQRLLTDVSDLQMSPNTSQSYDPSEENNKNEENHESERFLGEEKKTNLDVEPYYQDTPSSSSSNSNSKFLTNGSRRFGGIPLNANNGDEHSLPAIEEARTYAASLLHSANQTNSFGSSSQDPFARTDQHSSSRHTNSTTRHHSHASIDRNKSKNEHVLRQQICATVAKSVVFILLFILLALVVAVGLVVSRNNDSSSHQTPEISISDEKPPLTRLEQTYNFIHNALLTETDNLMDANSGQYMAANWIAEMDGLTLPIPTTLESAGAHAFVQRFVLAALYYSTNGPKTWRGKFGFLSEQNECAWFGESQPVSSFGSPDQVFAMGVTCNDKLEVVNILLPANALQGALPPEIGYLTALNMFAAPHNQLDGSIPDTMVNLVNLEYLDLKFNFLDGRIPNIFETLGNLQVLGLSNNYLKEGLPPSFVALTNLRTLALDDNLLTGDFTATVNSMTSLEYLYADRNNFTGKVDDFFLRGATQLREVDLSANQFTANEEEGVFPRHLLQHPTLTILDLADNAIRATLPTNLEDNLVLRFLSLRSNELLGQLNGTSLPKLQALEHLDIQGNQFQGLWPEQMVDMKNLTYMFLGHNHQIKSGEIPSWLFDMTQLQELSLTDMQMRSTIPAWIQVMKSLVFVDFSNNQLTGNLHRALFDLPNLSYILLHNNSLTGQVPQDIVGGDEIQMLTLHDNDGVFGDMNHVCTESPSIELLAVNCGDEIDCADSCCPRCCDRQAAAGVNSFCFKEAVPTYLHFFEGLWELNFTRSKKSFNPELVTDKPGNPDQPQPPTR